MKRAVNVRLYFCEAVVTGEGGAGELTFSLLNFQGSVVNCIQYKRRGLCVAN